jgi:hypothetical protein
LAKVHAEALRIVGDDTFRLYSWEESRKLQRVE